MIRIFAQTFRTFDPEAFLSATTTEVNTRRKPIPGGLDFIGIMGKPKMRQVDGKTEKTQGQTFLFLDIPVEIDLTSRPDLAASLGYEKAVLNWSTSIDITPQGGFDMSSGKNNGLRQLREALDLNNPGQPFNLHMVEGRPVRCKIKNEPYQDEIYDKISGLARVS